MEQRLEEEPHELPQSHVVFRVPFSAKSLAYARVPRGRRAVPEDYFAFGPHRDWVSPDFSLIGATHHERRFGPKIGRGGPASSFPPNGAPLMVGRETQSTRFSQGIFTHRDRLSKLPFPISVATNLCFSLAYRAAYRSVLLTSDELCLSWHSTAS